METCLLSFGLITGSVDVGHFPLGCVRNPEQTTHLILLIYGQRSPEENALACVAFGSVTQRHSDALSPHNKRDRVLLRPPSGIKSSRSVCGTII